jgi:GAF domain-containing protein
LDLGDSARSVVPRLRSCLSTPLVTSESLVGVLSLYSELHEAFSHEHQRILEVVAPQISPAILQAALLDNESNARHKSDSRGSNSNVDPNRTPKSIH